MAEMPMDFWSRAHCPPLLPPEPTAFDDGGGAVWDQVRRRREKRERRERSVGEMWFLEVILVLLALFLALLCFLVGLSLSVLSLLNHGLCFVGWIDR